MSNSLDKYGSNGKYTTKKKKETESTYNSSTASSDYKAPSNSIAKRYGSNGDFSNDSSNFKSAYEFKSSTPFKSSVKPVTVLKPTTKSTSYWDKVKSGAKQLNLSTLFKSKVPTWQKALGSIPAAFGTVGQWANGDLQNNNGKTTGSKFLGRTLDVARNTVTGGAVTRDTNKSSIKTPMNTGSKIGNIGADLLGMGAGFGVKQPLLNNNSLGSGLDKAIGKPINNALLKGATKLGLKTTKPLTKIAIAGLKSGAEFGGLNGMTSLANGKTGKETLKSVGEGALSGLIFGAGGKALGETGKSLKGLIPQKASYKVNTQRNLKMNTKVEVPKLNTPEAILQPKINNPKGILKPGVVKMKSDTMPLVDRTFENVGDKKVNAYQYDNPTLKPYIKEEANIIKGELERTLKPSKGANSVNGESIGYGNKRVTSESMATIKDTTGASYEKINKALDDIVVDHGRENNALAKKVELVIDDRLTNGYREDVQGMNIPSHGEYLQEKKFINDMPNELNTSTFKRTNLQPKLSSQVTLKPLDANIPIGNKLQTTIPKSDIVSTNMDMKSEAQSNNFGRNDNITNDTMLDGIEFSGKPAKVSKVYSNTLKNTDLLTKVEKNMLKSKDFSYDTRTEQMSLNEAKQRIATNIDGEIKSLNKKEVYSGSDVDTMMGILGDNKLVQARETGNYTDTKNWLKNVRKAGTEGGRTVQSFAKYSRTSEGKLIEGQRVVDAVEDNLKKSNPNLIDAIDKQTKQVMKDISTMTDKQKEARLKQIFGKKTKSQPKSMIEKVNELIELGAYDKESIRDLIKNKEGLPTLDTTDIKFINDHMKLANDAIPDSYINRMELAKVGGLIAEKTPSTNMEKLQAAQRISMLFNPKTTIVRNPLGNTLLNTAESIKNIPGAAIDKVVSGIRKSERTTILAPITKGKAALKGAKQGINEWRLDIKNHVDTGVTGGGMELPNKSKIFNESAKNPVQRTINKSANKIHSFVARSLKLGDTPFYNAAYSERLAELKKIKGTTIITDAMKEDANLYGLERTLQNDSAFSALFTGVKGANFLNKHEGAKTVYQTFANLILPFAKTPANVLDKFVDYSPVGILKATAQGIATKGKGTFNQKKFVDTMARGLTGTGLAVVGYKLAENGSITGTRNKNTKVENFETTLGKGNYAFKVGDNYQTVDWALPAAAPIMMGADIYNSLKKSKGLGGALADGTGSAVNLMFNSTLLQGPSRLLGGYNPAASLASGLLGTTTQATPTIGNQLRQLKDPFVRETYDQNPLKQTVNKLTNRIPGLSTSLPKKVDTSGNDIKNFQGNNSIFNVMLNPGFNTKYNASNTQKEVMRLYDDSGETDQIPGIATKVINKTKNNPQVNLTGEEFSAYQKMIGEKTIQAYNQVISDGKYSGSSDADKAQMLSSAMTKAKAQAKEDTLKAKGLYKKGGY